MSKKTKKKLPRSAIMLSMLLNRKDGAHQNRAYSLKKGHSRKKKHKNSDE